VPLARDLHPEFGYIGNAPAVLRKLGFATAFVAFGLIAAISNFSVFVTQPDDPMTAMALAPEQALNIAAAAAPRQIRGSELYRQGGSRKQALWWRDHRRFRGRLHSDQDASLPFGSVRE